MTKRELFNRIKDGAVYGHDTSFGVHVSIWIGEGSDGKDYIFFENYGRWASRISYKEFAASFSVAWDSANAFLKCNHELNRGNINI